MYMFFVAAFYDLDRVNVQMFAETANIWAGGGAGLCWMAPVCGRALIVEVDGGVYSCDHYVTPEHRIGDIYGSYLGDLANSAEQKIFGEKKRDSLPHQCRTCAWLSVCNGGCPKDRFALSEDKEPGLNFLCEGLRKFFSHAQPAMNVIIQQTKQGKATQAIMADLRAQALAQWKGIGRNDPCPCGSGKKAKNCCWSKRPFG